MKKIVFMLVLALTVLTSCSTLEKATYFPAEESLYKIDFSRYSDKGFLVTPEKYNGAYESIGLLSYELIPASYYLMTKREVNPEYDRRNPDSQRTFDTYAWIDNEINVQMALDSLYQICVENGADALMNFNQSFTFKDHTDIANPHTVVGIKLEGFAIKRK